MQCSEHLVTNSDPSGITSHVIDAITSRAYDGGVAITAVKRNGTGFRLERQTTVTNLTTTVDTLLAAWNEPNPTRRAELIERVWATDGRLIDPPLAAEGHAGISDMVATLQTQFPGHRFRRSSGIDEHHGYLRYGWELVGPEGAVALAGIDVGELAEDGKLRRITGFFGPLPAAENA
jgi:hypothetical protein